MNTSPLFVTSFLSIKVWRQSQQKPIRRGSSSRCPTVARQISVGLDSKAYISDQTSRFTVTIHKHLFNSMSPTQNQQNNFVEPKSDWLLTALMSPHCNPKASG